MPDVQIQRRFLEALYGDLPEGLHYYIWWTCGKPKRTTWCRTVEQGLAAIAAAPEGAHIYSGVALAVEDKGPGRRVTAGDAAGTVGLVTDIDVAGEQHGAKPYPPNLDAALYLIGDLALQPSMTVCSGNGLQCWWLWRETWAFGSPQERAEGARLAEGWTRYIQAAAKRRGWYVDSVYDLARVLRVAGTDNHKTDPPRPVTIRGYAADVRYNPEDVEPYLPEMPRRDVPPMRLDPDAAQDETDRETEERLAEDAEWVDRFRAILANDPVAMARWNREADIEDRSASGYAWALACRLHQEHNCSEIELTRAVQAFYDLRKREGDHKLHPAKLRMTVQRAMQSKPKTDAPTAEEKEALWEARMATAEAERTEKRQTWSLTDLGNAERMVALHGENLRYSYPLNAWYVWDGARWRKDDIGEVQRRAVATIRSMLAEIKMLPAGSDEAQALYKHAMKSEGERRIAAMIVLAKGLPGIAIMPEELDSDPWALNVINGTIDLRTGALRPHRKADLNTKMAPVRYDAEARSETWDAFLQRATSTNGELLDFLQRAAGYALTGLTREEKLFFVHGPSRTGKTTFLEALLACVGDYGATASLDAFLEQKYRASHSEELACLEGVRLVICAESRKGRRWDEERVKQITGGDTVRARAMYKDSTEWLPRLKLWVASNTRPRVAWESDAMWERIVEVPFVVPIPPEERRSDLKEKLRDHVMSGPAILAWAVQGCIAWQQRRLVAPEIVQVATEVYRDEMDPLGEWVAECAELGPQHWTATRELYGDYKDWCGENQVRFPLAPKDFGQRLRGFGCEPRQKANGGSKGWTGIALRASEHLPT